MKQTLDSKLYQDSLKVLGEVISNVNYSIVGGIGVQIYSHLNDKLIPKRTTSDIDLSVPLISFNEFQGSYGSRIAKYFKNKLGYGYHLRKNQFANTVHLFDNKNKDEDFILLHFNRYQSNLYSKIKNEILNDLDKNVVSISLEDLDIESDKKIKVLSSDRIKYFKKDKISKKREIFKLESFRDSLFIDLLEDIENGVDLKSYDVEKVHSQLMKGIKDPNSQYQFTKDIYDYLILSFL